MDAQDRHDSEADRHIWARAAEILRRNDLGGWTKAAPDLYPHQWSWDSAFIAIGLAQLDTRRAAQELSTLFAAQWANGKIPHIVFNPNVPPKSYFPDSEYWGSSALSADAPRQCWTSGLCQPPVHAIAAWRIWEVARTGGQDLVADARTFLRDYYPRLLAWHRYLATARDPEQSGLVTIYHPWEGMDNSPRWDSVLSTLRVDDLPPYTRYDLQHVKDPSQRPTQAEYDRYLWLVQLLKRDGYDDSRIQRSYPFLVKDVFFSAILVAANEALLKIADLVGAPDGDRELISQWMRRGQAGLEARWDPELNLCLDYDLRAGAALRVRTVAGFASLVAAHVRPERLQALLATLDSEAFLGYPKLRWRVPPSTSPLDPAFQPRSYWRGPTWPVITWLIWWSLVRVGEAQRAERLRQAAMAQLVEGGFAEYFEPFTGEPLGSPDQSWTAAVALDWLAA